MVVDDCVVDSSVVWSVIDALCSVHEGQSVKVAFGQYKEGVRRCYEDIFLTHCDPVARLYLCAAFEREASVAGLYALLDYVYFDEVVCSD